MNLHANNQDKIILWGATGQAKVLRECFESQGYNIIAVFDNNLEIDRPFIDIPLFYGERGFESWQQGNGVDGIGFCVAIGGDKGKTRLAIQDYLMKKKLVPKIAKHPTAFVADNAKVGDGSQILAHACVCVDVNIGRGCIINTGAIVDHECQIGHGTHICPGVKMAGCVRVGECVMIGTGAIVLPRIQIGDGAVIGAGAVVTKNVDPHTIIMGNPARFFRKTQ
jgi:sugar O-acyltransferase (sialic acid O-acetyltransferase NeuD family)